jgi:hypothetical protein
MGSNVCLLGHFHGACGVHGHLLDRQLLDGTLPVHVHAGHPLTNSVGQGIAVGCCFKTGDFIGF